MTDIKKIIEEQINQAWARGTNWAMQGRGYALDTNADTQADVLIELFKNSQEEARAEERAEGVKEGIISSRQLISDVLNSLTDADAMKWVNIIRREGLKKD